MRMRIVLIVAGAVCAGCGGKADDGSPSVVASFYPLAYAAEQVAGPAAHVRNLTPPGAEPHDLELAPRDVEALRDADLVLLLGERFQPQLEDAAGKGEHVVHALDTPGLRLLEGGDPHVWLDPVRYAVVVERIGEALGRPGAAARLGARLRALDLEFRAGLAGCARRELVTSHEAFAYLADRYRLRQIPIAGRTPEAEPAPRDLERAVEAVRRTGASRVFVEPLVSARAAETVAREAGVETAVLNPVEGLTEDEQGRGEDYFTIMRANLETLREALACR